MEVSLCKANLDDAATIHEMQVKAFMPLLEKYQDYDTNPANESLDRIITRFNQPFTDYYLIKHFEDTIGGIRVVKMRNKSYRVSPIFILPEHQGKGIAQEVFAKIEHIYRDAKLWKLDTIIQEVGLCYLYEKLGYKKTGETKEISDKITIVFYEKSHVNKNYKIASKTTFNAVE
ncbi:GNAT family N-acetyltransferase [Solibacillus sp. MA9]|uniref:GNAT family N-acetyltransferase n=1 Tax=Solibacillus palustris TaxID=2908203 RepID=A0ABS9UEL4_9BACL|nr:GNAT family N-acetyltransferase [Solibacillus sp. MA9]MCH7322769.1 GNAT family N-acetyltransferase [Solibacillus sp. MA9]